MAQSSFAGIAMTTEDYIKRLCDKYGITNAAQKLGPEYARFSAQEQARALLHWLDGHEK